VAPSFGVELSPVGVRDAGEIERAGVSIDTSGCPRRPSNLEPRFGGAFSCVPSMIESLEVEVLYPA